MIINSVIGGGGGSGLPAGITEIACGTVTAPSWSSGFGRVDVTHGMSASPKWAIAWDDNWQQGNPEWVDSDNQSLISMAVYDASNSDAQGGTWGRQANNGTANGQIYKSVYNMQYGGIQLTYSSTQMRIVSYAGSRFRAGNTVKWVAGR